MTVNSYHQAATTNSTKSNVETSLPNVLLSDLALRPSSLQWWHQQGFRSTMEVQQGLQVHANGSMIQWAQDLLQGRGGGDTSSSSSEQQRSVGFLARLYREVQSCLEAYVMETKSEMATTTTHDGVLFVRGQNAATLVQQYHADVAATASAKAIVTFCRHVDQLLGGGLPLGELTEIAGPPGMGKTQWAMQLAVNVQTPRFFGGVAGRAIYIDTEGSLTPERCHDMARHLVHHVTQKHAKLVRTRPEIGPQLPEWFTIEGLLDGIQVIRVYDVASIDATISMLEATLTCESTTERPVQLIVVDSLAFPVRAESTNDFIGRTQQLTQWAIKLSQLAQSYPPKAVVVLNQMTTTTATTPPGAGMATVSATSSTENPTGSMNTNENAVIVGGTTLTPALGEAWAHAVTNRIILAQGTGETRLCRLVKSPRLPSGQAEYTIVEGGIRDVNIHQQQTRPSKRPRISDIIM